MTLRQVLDCLLPEAWRLRDTTLGVSFRSPSMRLRT